MSEEEPIKIPKKEWYHFKDIFSRVDELLETIAKTLSEIKKEITEIKEKIVAVPPAVPAPPTVTVTPEVVPVPIPTPTPTPTPAPTAPEIKFPKSFMTRGLPYIPLRTVKYTVSNSEDTIHRFLDETEAFIIIFYDDDLKIDLISNTNENTPVFPEGSVIYFERAEQLKNIYLRAKTTSATVYIMELMYVKEER